MRIVWWILFRVLRLCVVAGLSMMLVLSLGPWIGAAVWAGAMLVVCAAVAFLLSKQPMGRPGPINVIAGFVLPWGYTINGKLPAIVVASWIGWSAMGAMAMIVIVLGQHTGGGGAGSGAVGTMNAIGQSWPVRALLLATWLIDGAGIVYLVNVMGRNRRANRVLVGSTLILVGLIVASAAVALVGRSGGATLIALAIAGGPPACVAAPYGLFLGAMLTVGRKANWH